MDQIILIVSMLCLSAFFSGMEIAYVAANKLRMELEKNKNTVTSRIISIFTKNPGQFITTMLVGNNIALVVYGIIMAKVLEPYLEVWFTSPSLIITLQTIFSTIIILVTAEFLPKTLFRINPNQSLNVFSLPLLFFYILFYPISIITMYFSKNIISRIFKTDMDQDNKKQVFGKHDLDHLIQEGQQTQNYLEDEQHDMKIFRNALDFSKVKLRECFVPRTEIEAIEINYSLEELKQRFIETGYSRILIYKESIDNIIGYVHSSMLFRNPKSLKAIITPIIIVPETMQAQKLLKLFTQDNKGVALVVDEFGGTSGMVTIEDIMEEIFGEIEDEHDSIDLIEQKLTNEEYIFSGRIEIDYINDKYNLKLRESDEYETLAGFILYNHENVPKLNEIIKIENFKFKIIAVSETRIEKLHLQLL